MPKKTWKMSASLISCFKACAFRCYAKYVLGIIQDKDSDPLRIGSNYHRCLEILGMKPGAKCPECADKDQNDLVCPLCSGVGVMGADMMDAVVLHLNQAYKDVPVYKTREEWLTERAILLYSIAGYNWRYADDDYEVVAEEIAFELPVRNPATGRALPNVTIVGKIDKITRSPEGLLYIDEHKSTGSSLDSDSTLWSHLNLDTQTTLYPFAARQLQLEGKLEVYGIKATDPLITGVRYDVWHKPGIKQKKLTQGDSQQFVEDGMYMDELFEVEVLTDEESSPCCCLQGTAAENDMTQEEWMAVPVVGYRVNGEITEFEPGKKEGTFAIRETAEMFGARLLADIGERPDFYFARVELARTEKDFKRFEAEVYGIYKSVRFIGSIGAWWHDEKACEATFKCPYIPYCYNNVEMDPSDLQEGFKLTKWAQELQETIKDV